MIIAIGTISKRKVSVLEKVLKEVAPNKTFEILPYAANSGVPYTPWEDETILGAENRAMDCKENIKGADYYIGLESGLVTRYNRVYEETWCYILSHKDEVFTSYSSGLKVPDTIIKRMSAEDKKHWEVMNAINEEQGTNDESDTWGTYSGKSLSRNISLEEALRNTLIQIFKPKDSLF